VADWKLTEHIDKEGRKRLLPYQLHPTICWGSPDGITGLAATVFALVGYDPHASRGTPLTHPHHPATTLAVPALMKHLPNPTHTTEDGVKDHEKDCDDDTRSDCSKRILIFSDVSTGSNRHGKHFLTRSCKTENPSNSLSDTRTISGHLANSG